MSGTVVRGGTGDWTVNSAKEQNINAKVIEEAVKFRKLSEKNPSYTGKLINIMRNTRFGATVFMAHPIITWHIEPLNWSASRSKI